MKTIQQGSLTRLPIGLRYVLIFGRPFLTCAGAVDQHTRAEMDFASSTF